MATEAMVAGCRGPVGAGGPDPRVRYMCEASVERQWYASMLAYGHRAQAASSRDLDGGRALSFAIMGYPAPYPADWYRADAMVLDDEARYLAAADLYVLTP